MANHSPEKFSLNQESHLTNMKVVILAGGYGTRISEESGVRPKPMVDIGDMPILWHIMKTFYAQGFDDFVICCGYKANVIKEYFANYALYRSDVTFDMKEHLTTIHKNGAERWKVTLIDTGEKTMTGGRLKRVKKYLGRETFLMTYGDGVCDVKLKELVKFHRQQKVLATVTAVQSPGRFGAFSLGGSATKITSFREKPKGDGVWINGGFFVLEPRVLNYIKGDDTVWEREPMQRLARTGQLAAFKHSGFWHPMDTLRDKNVLEEFWQSGRAPWKVWKD